jgi:hypothetical protein|tara:strand:+ start:5362 stop:6030 length:669 start_codon:yes stop_codon:yes gene_type:complete
MWITPDPFTSNRSKEAVSRVGCLPIYEKENAFSYIDSFDQIAIIDADIYIRPDADNIFEEFGTDHAFGAVAEREMNIQDWYKGKIKNYSAMQYRHLHSSGQGDFVPNELGYEFFNMGMIVLNTSLFRPYLKGQTPLDFIKRDEFKDFVDGVGAYKWSTDQTLLNYFLKKYNIPTKHISPTFNGLFSAVDNINDCHFVHFFLKDKLPNGGENVKELMSAINAT